MSEETGINYDDMLSVGARVRYVNRAVQGGVALLQGGTITAYEPEARYGPWLVMWDGGVSHHHFARELAPDEPEGEYPRQMTLLEAAEVARRCAGEVKARLVSGDLDVGDPRHNRLTVGQVVHYRTIEDRVVLGDCVLVRRRPATWTNETYEEMGRLLVDWHEVPIARAATVVVEVEAES